MVVAGTFYAPACSVVIVYDIGSFRVDKVKGHHSSIHFEMVDPEWNHFFCVKDICPAITLYQHKTYDIIHCIRKDMAIFSFEFAQVVFVLGKPGRIVSFVIVEKEFFRRLKSFNGRVDRLLLHEKKTAVGAPLDE